MKILKLKAYVSLQMWITIAWTFVQLVAVILFIALYLRLKSIHILLILVLNSLESLFK